MKGRSILGQDSGLGGSVVGHRLVWLRMREDGYEEQRQGTKSDKSQAMSSPAISRRN